MAASLQLPILTLAVREQHYSCHGCGNCCRDFTVQLRDEDVAKLEAQGWEQKLGQPVTVKFRGQTYLRQRADGACIFLMENGLCRVHAEHGFAEKPIACQLFPFHLTPSSKHGLTMGINFACQSVLENKGADLRTHNNDLGRMGGLLAELHAPSAPPRLDDSLRASMREVESLTRHIDDWLRLTDLSLSIRLDGLAWIIGSLTRAKLQNVREEKFNDLLDVLFAALPDELEHYPIEAAAPRQRRMLRQAVFARTEDPKLNRIAAQGQIRLRLSQLMRSRRFKAGKGIAPKIGVDWPENLRLETIEHIAPASDPQSSGEIDDLMTRYLRASILGGRGWGAGYYSWPMISGLQALVLNIAVIGWLSRLHAAGAQRQALDIVDVRAALGRVDRSAGRAKWLGGTVEKLRLRYLNMDDGLRRVIAAYPLNAG